VFCVDVKPIPAKTMTMKAKGTDADGKPMDVTLVYDKQ
jgi:hypothetical protein